MSKSVKWDASQTLERLGGDENLLHEVLQIFLEGTPARLVTLRQAVNDCNAETLEKAVHSLKGELGYLGISALSQQARQLEEMGRNREMHRAAAVLSDFETGISLLLRQMQEMQNAKAAQVAAKSAGAGQ